MVDDWGLAAAHDIERRDLLEVMEDRDGNRSTIMTSQLPIEKWHDHLGDPTVDSEIGANHAALEETSTVRAICDAEVVQMLEALLCTVRRRVERLTGRLATRGEALGAMLRHVIETWDWERREDYPILERDGWRCIVPAAPRSGTSRSTTACSARRAGGGSPRT